VTINEIARLSLTKLVPRLCGSVGTLLTCMPSVDGSIHVTILGDHITAQKQHNETNYKHCKAKINNNNTKLHTY